MQKIRRRRELTFKFPLLPPPWISSCFCTPTYHHIEAPLVGALLKLPALEAPMDFIFLKLWATLGRKLWWWKWAQKEVDGEGASKMREVGGLVGRRVVGGLG
jgi:hypothetical protein